MNKLTENFFNNRIKLYYILCIFVMLLHLRVFELYNNFEQNNIIYLINKYFNFSVTLLFTHIAVPLFFMLSGVMLFRNADKIILANRIKKDLKLYVFHI